MAANKQKKIGILTSGGDAPGMNAVIRAIVRTAVFHNIKVIGIRRGYEGLLGADFYEMNAKSVSDIIHRGGTILLTARSATMMTEEGQEKAAQICRVLGLDALFVIGGDGSLRGAQALAKKGVCVFGIPGTIDLDLDCTEYTIGFDTAVNTGMEAINKIRDTSSSHERCSIVEVMGRKAGFIALWCAMSGGAEDVMIAENPETDKDAVIRQIVENRSKGKTHNLVIISEGIGGGYALAQEIQNITGIETRATILGHLQRGGSPTARDRMIGSMMGNKAVDLFVAGEKNRVLVYLRGRYEHMDIDEAMLAKRVYDNTLYETIKILAI